MTDALAARFCEGTVLSVEAESEVYLERYLEVFDVLAILGTANARSMAAGVSKATIPTMAGMVGALAGVFAGTVLSRLVTKETERLEEALTADH